MRQRPNPYFIIYSIDFSLEYLYTPSKLAII